MIRTIIMEARVANSFSSCPFVLAEAQRRGSMLALFHLSYLLLVTGSATPFCIM